MYLYNMYEYSSTKMGKEMFPDNLHPSDAGYVKMAEGVRDLVIAVMENGTNKYLITLGSES